MTEPKQKASMQKMLDAAAGNTSAVIGAERTAKQMLAKAAKPHRIIVNLTPEEYALFHRVSAGLQLDLGERMGNEKTVVTLLKQYAERTGLK